MSESVRADLLDRARFLASPGEWARWLTDKRPHYRGDFLLAWEEVQDWSKGNRQRLALCAFPIVELYLKRYGKLKADVRLAELWAYSVNPPDTEFNVDEMRDEARAMKAKAYCILAASNLAFSESCIALRPARAVALCIRAAQLMGETKAEAYTAKVVSERLLVFRPDMFHSNP